MTNAHPLASPGENSPGTHSNTVTYFIVCFFLIEVQNINEKREGGTLTRLFGFHFGLTFGGAQGCGFDDAIFFVRPNPQFQNRRCGAVSRFVVLRIRMLDVNYGKQAFLIVGAHSDTGYIIYKFFWYETL